MTRNAMPSSSRLRALALGAAIALPATAFAGPMQPTTGNPHPIDTPEKAALAATAVGKPAPNAPGPAAATPAALATTTETPATTTAPLGPQAPISVSTWGLSQTGPGGPPPVSAVTPGRPIYVWFTLDGGQAAVDQLQAGRPVAIQVHWTSDNTSGHAPPLTTNLTVGRPDLASTFAGEVQRTGSFQWHSWTRKDALSPGHWTVSLTAPDGQPLTCGQAPCQLSFDVG